MKKYENNISSIKSTFEENEDFLVMLEDRCDKYHIVTSINGLSYRIEVYCEGELEDAVERECNELRLSRDSETLFYSEYFEAHKAYMKKFCTKTLESFPEKENELENKNIIQDKEVKDNENENEKSNNGIDNISDKSRQLIQNIKDKPYTAGIILSISLLIILGRFLVCNETIIGLFFNKIDFYEKTEFLCNKLEKKCILLTNTNLDQDTKTSPEDCRNWCKNNIIIKNKCELFLPFFPDLKEEYLDTQYDKNTSNVVNVVKKIEPTYLIKPKGTIVLELGKYLELVVINNAMKTFSIELKSLHLDENEYEEIVQFSRGIISLSIEHESSKEFTIFLEPTYYEQFKKGDYHGKMTFDIIFEDSTKEEIVKDFTFKVQQ